MSTEDPGTSTGPASGTTPSAPATGASTGTATTARPPGRRGLPIWQESVLLLALAIVLAVVIKAFFVQAFYIPSESMEPGLVENDRILTQKVSYWFGGSPQRGDVVVFEDPGGWLGPDETVEAGNPLTQALSAIGLYPTGGHLVKRVIGVAGDTVKCCDAKGRITVNGVPLDEPYLQDEDELCNGPMTGDCDWTAGPVPEGELFVMGDNRGHSADSTVHLCQPDDQDCAKDPYVPVDLVVGKVFTVIWPYDHWDWLSRPDTFADVPDAS